MGFKKVCWKCGKPANRILKEETYLYPPQAGGMNIKIKRDIVLMSEDEISDILDKSFDNISIPRFYCDECLKLEKEKIATAKAQCLKLKKMLMLERAIQILEKQKINLYDYKDILDSMELYVLENPNKFDSAHEMIAAIILSDNEIKSHVQYKIGNYRVDFYLPDLKIILEIDGDLHKNTLYKDNKRDIEIRKILGEDWETVRIGTKYIEQNAEMLVEAMIEIKCEKQRIRKKNYGELPEWYSKRDKAKKKRSFKTGDDNLLL